MQEATRDAIIGRSVDTKPTGETARILDEIEKHFATGENAFFYIRNEEEFNDIAELLGQTEFDAAQVIAYSLIDTSKGDGRDPVFNSEPKLKGKSKLWDLLSWLGDFTMNSEFPSNFKAKLVVKLDEETAVFYDYESSSYAVVCEDCAQLEEYQPGGGSEDYSCDHAGDEYSSRFHVGITKIFDKKTITKFLESYF